MTSRPNKTDSQQPEVVSADDRQYELATEIVAIQRERNAISERALEVTQQEIQLRYDFLAKQTEVQEAQNKRGYRLMWLIVGGFMAVLFLLIYMMFFGSEAQVGKAEKILTEGAKALGGAGFILLVYGGLKRLINR